MSSSEPLNSSNNLRDGDLAYITPQSKVEILYEPGCGYIIKKRPQDAEIRQFDTGAIRDTEEGKLDYEGFNHPSVEERFAVYMHKHRALANGQLRDSDNWQKGIPKAEYVKSMFRHFMDVWKAHRGLPAPPLEESLCALRFNVNGLLYEILKEKPDARSSGV